jgi:hypothetical protein
MSTIRGTNLGRWFMRIIWIGVVANLALAIPTMIAPDRMLALTSLPSASPLLWPRFASLLLILLSGFYMPAGVDADRYRANAWFAVGARLVGFTFFLSQPSEYLLLGVFDLTFFIPEAILLTLAIKSAAAQSTPEQRDQWV